MNHEQKKEEALWRADMYQVLALGHDTPSEKNLKGIKEIAADLLTIRGNSPSLPLMHALLEALEKERYLLMEEYQTLFVTKMSCSPSEGSYHLAERGPILGDVAAFYEAFRVRMHSESGPPDTMKMELAFMHYMALKKVHALLHHLGDEYEITEDAEKKFLGDHLGRWVERFGERLFSATSLSFYKMLADLLKQWIAEECAYFQITPTPLPISLAAIEQDDPVQCAVH